MGKSIPSDCRKWQISRHADDRFNPCQGAPLGLGRKRGGEKTGDWPLKRRAQYEDTRTRSFDNAKQRNLNEKGKELAKAFGDAIRQVGIPAGEVYASNFNRAFETAVLAGFKDIEKTTDLTEGGLVVSPDENSRRAHELINELAKDRARISSLEQQNRVLDVLDARISELQSKSHSELPD